MQELMTRRGETVAMMMSSSDSQSLHSFPPQPIAGPDAHPSALPAAYRSGGFAGIRGAAEVLRGQSEAG